jgi:hypothetical protein
MLDEREKLLLRMALAYAHANVDDLNEAFSNDDDGVIVHNHTTGVHQTTKEATEKELSAICAMLTGQGLD